MKFRTPYSPQRADFSLSPEHPVVMLGSCFSDNITERMREALWDASNPLGTLYNPLSIKKTLEIFLFENDLRKRFADSLFIDAQGKCRSFLGDFRLAADNVAGAIDKAEKARHTLLHRLNNAEALFITFGTSICYSLLPEKDPEDIGFSGNQSRKELLSATVANCHKLPASRFERYRLTPEEISKMWIDFCRKIRNAYPHLRIVFTVSPVRHLKDGFIANARSKAILLLAIEEICSELDYCSYFPAYEILNDDLRDYRFYASDLLHPSQQAVEYIWEIFKETYLDNNAISLLKEGENILKEMKHRPLLMNDQEQAMNRERIRQRYENFIESHPGMLKV